MSVIQSCNCVRVSINQIYLYNTNEGKQQEHKHITDALLLNGYPRKFLQEVERKRAIRQEKASSPEELVKEFFELVEPQSSYSYAVLPYIKGLIEPLKIILKPHDIRIATKPLYTLEQ